MAAKHQIMTRSQLEKINSEQLVQSFILLQDEILGKQTELLRQNYTMNERLGDLSEKLINIERRQYKIEQYSRRECIEIQGIPQSVTINNLEDTVIKIFEKIGISVNKRMIVACHRPRKTTKTIVKFANKKDAELVLKVKKS